MKEVVSTNRMLVRLATGMMMLLHSIVPSHARSSNVASSSWWLLHGLDGVPFLLERRRRRGGNTNKHRGRRMMNMGSSINNNSQISHGDAKEANIEWWQPVLDQLLPPSSSFHRSSSSSSSSSSRQQRILEFGDYVDPTYNCPPTTTCPIVCVASMEDCPSDALCPGTHPESILNPDHEYELCADGTCSDLTAGESCDPDATSPCGCDALPFVCAKQIDLYPTCLTRFQTQYDTESECLAEQEDSLPQVDFTGPIFLACYIGLSAVTLVMLVWCAWNQRWASVSGSTVPLEGAKLKSMEEEDVARVSTTQKMRNGISSSPTTASTNNEVERTWTQTGYTSTNIIGMSIYYLVVLAHLIIQFLLLALTVEYYVQQEAITTSIFGSQQFYDEEQVLMAFEITWMVGFGWCFFLKYPVSIHSLFLRRCLPKDANYIAVTAPVQSIVDNYKNDYIVKLLATLSRIFHGVLSFVYSDTSQRLTQGVHVTFCKVKVDAKTGSRYFYFRYRRYIFDATQNKYIPGCWDIQQDEKRTIGHWLDRSYLYEGLSNEEASMRRGIVGPNVLDLKKPTIIMSIANEFSKPFYLYQNFLVWTWAPYWYYYMAIVNTVVRITGGLVVALFQYMSDMSLYQLVVTEGTAMALRGGEMVTIDQTEIVPGDIVRLAPGLAYFDMAVLQAKRLLVDESALTGEVHPIAKTPLVIADADLAYNLEANKSSTIYAGSIILECGDGQGTDGDLAIVTKTGSFTTKGKFLSDVLSYQRHRFKFDSEVKLVLVVLASEAIILFSLVLSWNEDAWVFSWLYAMFVVGTVLPPLLPTVFVVSVGISCKRLQDKKITCTDSRGILVAGKVQRVFFDKTGTLTKQGLEFQPSDEAKEESSLLKRGLAVCQDLHLSNDGSLVGPSVDRIGFLASSAALVDDNTVRHEGEDIVFLKRFEFDHERMTQSVIVKRGEEIITYVKGSPEAIRKLCSESSLPMNFSEISRQSARDGIYQLAMATSTYKCDKAMNEVHRDDIEKDLDFVGFVNFQNSLKEDSPAVIEELRHGKIGCVMITGDNVLTGVHIATQVGIIDADCAVVIGNSIQIDGQIEWVNFSDDSPAVPSENTTLALTGEVWNHLVRHDPKTAIDLAKRTGVFGRCTPHDKVSIVSTFVEMGDIVLMCGDGGNDCGALKAAHVGIALSDAEASMVAPFTSLDKSIKSVTQVLKEGRCALASALASYKYMIIYGQVESINQVINAYFYITFTEWCWVFMDGLWSISMAFSLPLARAAKKITELRPTASILGPQTLSSACGILLINFLFLVFALIALWQQDWFQCRKWGSTDLSAVLDIGDNYESSVIFIVSGYQYIASAAALNFGYSFRSNWFRNYVFVFLFCLWTAFQFAATLSNSAFSCIWRVNCDNDHVVRSVTSTEPDYIKNAYNSTVMPMEFRGLLVGLMVANLILVCAWDYFIVNKMMRKCGRKVAITNK